jgi:hypothetical protein
VQPSPLYRCEYAHAQCVAPKDVGPAPAPGHDTWPTNLLHPHSAAAPCCRPLPPPRERDRDREANSSGWHGMAAELPRNTLAVCGRFVPNSKGALDQLATAVSYTSSVSPSSISLCDRVVSVPESQSKKPMSTTFLTDAGRARLPRTLKRAGREITVLPT